MPSKDLIWNVHTSPGTFWSLQAKEVISVEVIRVIEIFIFAHGREFDRYGMYEE